MLANTVIKEVQTSRNIRPTNTVEIFKQIQTSGEWLSLGTYTIELASHLLGVHSDEIIAGLNLDNGTTIIHNALGTYKIVFPPTT